ncbi:MAG TPA: flagellar motor switch protein FliG [Steroidobacteraceae bacterium]|jgi:flagellar motor switch protein FliG|nr:flagellar motor switch protein FliG [Steroidobacteraceae bacterium]
MSDAAATNDAERSGTERAAILLLTLGEHEAAQVLKHMGAREVQKIGAAMAQLQNVSREEVSGVLSAFSDGVGRQTSVGVGVDEFLRNVMTNALGEEKAANVIERINVGLPNKGLETLKWMDSRSVAEVIHNEHPQIIAIVLAYLEPDMAADVMRQLPTNLHADVMMRIATLDGVQPAALSELDEVIEKSFASTSSRTSELGGEKAAANIINALEPAIESSVMEHITNVDSALGARIQDLVFVFDNLIDVDDRGLQEILRQVQGDQLLLALKGCDEPLKQKIFKNMSQRAAEMLRDDLEAKGPVRLAYVEAAQKEILAVARKLAEEGTIALGGKGEAFV